MLKHVWRKAVDQVTLYFFMFCFRGEKALWFVSCVAKYNMLSALRLFSVRVQVCLGKQVFPSQKESLNADAFKAFVLSSLGAVAEADFD